MIFKRLRDSEIPEFKAYADEAFSRLSIDGAPINIMHPVVRARLAVLLTADASFACNNHIAAEYEPEYSDN